MQKIDRLVSRIFPDFQNRNKNSPSYYEGFSYDRVSPATVIDNICDLIGDYQTYLCWT